MTKYPISMIPVFIIVLLLALCTQNITIGSKAFAQLPVPNVNSNTSSVATNNNVTMTIHTTNSIRGHNFNAIKQVEPVIRRAILSNINNAVLLHKSFISSYLIYPSISS
ncbi:MAG: hypothetical protein WA364_14170 [Candidatus Nitrosopolaris sp.]